MTFTGNASLLQEIARYYGSRLAEYGATPRGVDWNGEESQRLRFEQLSKIIDIQTDEFSLNDLGCGYGALFDFLNERRKRFFYTGIDISEEMLHAAQSRHCNHHQARFVLSGEPDKVADYGVASGIFNVRQERSDTEWLEYLKATLDSLDKTSRLGFGFNCLTSYSDENKKRSYLYYANPCQLFDLCKSRYSRNVALLHDYRLYEFTILVRK